MQHSVCVLINLICIFLNTSLYHEKILTECFLSTAASLLLLLSCAGEICNKFLGLVSVKSERKCLSRCVTWRNNMVRVKGIDLSSIDSQECGLTALKLVNTEDHALCINTRRLVLQQKLHEFRDLETFWTTYFAFFFLHWNYHIFIRFTQIISFKYLCRDEEISYKDKEMQHLNAEFYFCSCYCQFFFTLKYFPEKYAS